MKILLTGTGSACLSYGKHRPRPRHCECSEAIQIARGIEVDLIATVLRAS
jgi:hypothetical protein